MIECPFCDSLSICNADNDYLFYCEDCEESFGRYCEVEKCPFRYDNPILCNHFNNGICIIE